MNIQHVFELAENQAVQLTVLIAVAGLIVPRLLKRWPHLAYILWLAVLIKSLTPPVWSSSMGVFSFTQRESRETHELPIAQPMVRWDAVRVSAQPTQRNAVLAIQPKESAVSHPWTFEEIVLAAWAVGALGFFGFVAFRWIAVHRRIARYSVPPSLELLGLVEDLRRKFGIRRQISLRVCTQPIGPAVIGFVRPILVIPARIVEEKTLRDLRPLVAHEIIHLRRGDPLVAMLQIISQGVWWFHPLVWWMNREMVRTREFCCDAEVIASADCRREDYAQMLIDVLRLRRCVGSLVGSPGVRPSHITERRLSRIMSDGPGARRTPWGYWVVLGLCAMVVLPGAAVSGDSPTTAPAVSRADANQIVPISPPAASTIRSDQAISDYKRILDAQALAGNTELTGKLLSLRFKIDSLQSEIDSMKKSGYSDKSPNLQYLAAQRAALQAQQAAMEQQAIILRAVAGSGTIRHFVTLVVDKDSISFQGQKTTLENLPSLLVKVPDREHTVLQLAYASGDVTMRDFSNVQNQAQQLVTQFGFEYLSLIGEHSADTKGGPDETILAGKDYNVVRIQPALTPAAEIELTHLLKVQLGKMTSHPGDSLVITEVRGTSDRFEVDGTYQVKGTYTLSSQDHATLGISVSAKDPKNAMGNVGKWMNMQITRGSGTFVLTERFACEGYPHISMNSDAGNLYDVYFGSGDWLLK